MTLASKDGFTLIEILVAIAILGVSLTALFSIEAGSIKSSARARNMGTATLLARCKMAELEEQVAKEGLPAIDDSGDGECCEGIESEGFSCKWAMKRIELPDQFGEEEDEDGNPITNLGGEDSTLTGGSAMDAMLSGGGGDGFASIAFDIAYPIIKPQIEEQVRRAEVIVEWNEGDATRSLDVVQFLVSEIQTAAVTGTP